MAGHAPARRTNRARHRQLARHRPGHRAEACGRGSGDLAPLPSKRSRAQSVGREISGQSRLLKADLGLPKNIDAMFESLGGTRLHILVNNAGVWGPTPLGSTSVQQLDAMLDTNLKGLFWITQAALPYLQDGANIVNISSVAGRIGIAAGRSACTARRKLRLIRSQEAGRWSSLLERLG